jgi:hypothetical protein
VATNVSIVTGHDEAGATVNVGVGMDSHGRLVLISPGADLSTIDALRHKIARVAREHLQPRQATALANKLHDVVVDHFEQLGARETVLSPDVANQYLRLARVVNNTL